MQLVASVPTVIEGLCETSHGAQISTFFTPTLRLNSQLSFQLSFSIPIWGIIYTGKGAPVCVFISLINVSAQLVEFRRRVIVGVQALVHRVQGERLKVLLERLRVLAPRVLADLVERVLDRLVVWRISILSIFFQRARKLTSNTSRLILNFCSNI